MSKEDLKIKPVEQELTKEDLKKVNGGDKYGDEYGGKNDHKRGCDRYHS